MRLGEIKANLEKVLNDDNKIFVNAEAIFGGQAFVVKNFWDIAKALEILFDQKWNEADPIAVKKIIGEHENGTEVQLPAAEFNQLNAYINSLNTKINIYYSILDTMVEDQEEQIINIKLPENKAYSLNDLAELNKRLDKMLKKFSVDGQFEFKGFDKGSEWYEIYTNGFLSYTFIIGCLKIAREYLETKTTYYNSEMARLDYEASLKKADEFTQKGFEEYMNRRLELKIEKGIKNMIEKIGKTNGHAGPELQTKLISATKDLIKEIGGGVEFHLSLNPPEYVRDQGGSLEIDYKSIRELNVLEDRKPKQLETAIINNESDK